MPNIQDLINLAKADGGKFFVIDETGEPKLVMMSIGDYQELLLGKMKHEVQDIERINQEIVRAQLQEQESEPPVPPIRNPRAIVDMREEVIDPSFDFEGPKVEIED